MADRLFQIFDIKSRWVSEGEKRLNASSYFYGSINAKILLTKLVDNNSFWQCWEMFNYVKTIEKIHFVG